MNNREDQGKPKKAGYEYLLAYKVTVSIYDLTVAFCNKYLLPNSPDHPYLPDGLDRPEDFTRTHDQMVQSARSGMQNIVEGNKQESLKGYIYLSGIARGSLEELLKDYLSFVRHHKIPVWTKERAMREIREIEEIWEVIRRTPTLPDTPNFPDLPKDPVKAVNLMITLINQANYLVDKLIIALKDRHMKVGGLTEELHKKRREYRGY